MRKVFRLEDLCCANCAQKIQDRISKLDGVNSCSVNFLTQKFTLDTSDSRFDAAFAESKKIFKSVEPDCTIIL
jgi:copper chaperone CopZ